LIIKRRCGFIYLHIGSDFIINEQDILGVFDFDNVTTSKTSMNFIKALEDDGRLFTVTGELPKSFILTLSGGVEVGYLSPVNSRTIQARPQSLSKIYSRTILRGSEKGFIPSN
jgi:hypothetical protein